MKLYVWEGGQGDYHDSGTLAIIAENVEQVREMVAKNKAEEEIRSAEIQKLWNDRRDNKITEEERIAKMTPLWRDMPGFSNTDLVARKPDRILSLTKPQVAVVNHGCDC